MKQFKITALFIFLSCLVLTSVYTYNKKVVAIVDGELEVYYTSALTYDFLAEEIAKQNGFDDYVFERSTDSEFVEHNETFEISSKKELEVIIDSETIEVETYADTPEQLLEELDVEEPENTSYVPTNMGLLKYVDSLEYAKIEKVTVTETTKEDLAMVEVEDSSINKGVTMVADPGTPNEYENVYEVVYHNGEVYSKVLVSKDLVKEGTAGTLKVGTKVIPTLPANYASGSTVWDSIASCESGGNWSINTGNGYYGGLQFSAASWRTAASAVGVSAEYAHQASREDQIRAAEWMLSKSSWQQQWPSCSKKLGLW